jgi:hypothetical protein
MCAALPANSLTDKLALIQRGSCTFETKVLFAAAAGAKAALIYSGPSQPDDFFTMETGTANLPAAMMRFADGQALLERLSGGEIAVTLNLSAQAFEVEPGRVPNFSSQGPLPGVGLKPDFLAVGTNVFTAAQSNTPAGDIYSTSRYAVVGGTSFSAPIAAGALAALKAARPGLSGAQYRALLIQSARALDEQALATQGAGLVQMAPALDATVLMNPPSVTFTENTRKLTLQNLRGEPQAYLLNVETRKGTAPQLSASTVEVGAGGEAALEISLDLAGVPAGTHEGYVTIANANGLVQRVPYWYGKPLAEAARIQVLHRSTTAPSGVGLPNTLLFRVLDTNGLSLEQRPKITVVSGAAEVLEIEDRGTAAAGALGMRVILGRGANVFEIDAGNDVKARVTINGF